MASHARKGEVVFFSTRLLCTRLHSPEKSLQEKKLALQTNFMRPNAVF